MVNSSSVRQQQDPESRHPPVDVSPIPPPPLQQPMNPPRSNASPHYSTYQHQPPTTTSNPLDKRSNIPPSSSYNSLPMTRLAPLSNNIPSTLPLQTATASRPTPYLASSKRITTSQSSALPSPTPIQGQSTTMLPRIQTGIDNDPPTLAPLKNTTIGSQISPLHHDSDKLENTRPMKRSRISSVPSTSMGLADISTSHGHGSTNVLNNPSTTPVGTSTFGGVGPTSESNCGSGSDDRGGLSRRNTSGGVSYGADRGMHVTNSSSPSRGEYSIAHGRNEGFERNSAGMGTMIRGHRNIEEAQSNDWEVVFEMYTTGKGTEDGIALKSITKGDGRRVADRKLLEKRRTIGKTYERLGGKRFEAAIGYKWENGIRRKQKMYHVINRCRVVNAMHKNGEQIPEDCDELTALIDQRIAAKEAIKEAGKMGGPIRRPELIGGSGLSNVGMNEIGSGTRLIPIGNNNNITGNQMTRYGMEIGNRREEENLRYGNDRNHHVQSRAEESGNHGGRLNHVETGYSQNVSKGQVTKYGSTRMYDREGYR